MEKKTRLCHELWIGMMLKKYDNSNFSIIISYSRCKNAYDKEDLNGVDLWQ